MLAKEKTKEIIPKIDEKQISKKTMKEIKVKEVKETKEEPKVEEKPKQTLSDLPGVGPATIEKLETVGYNDLMSVAVATPGELIEVTGMNQSAAKKVIAAARTSGVCGYALAT